jgi:hypothetical protein
MKIVTKKSRPPSQIPPMHRGAFSGTNLNTSRDTAALQRFADIWIASLASVHCRT